MNPEVVGPFRKASYSEQSGACIEVARDATGGSFVRDSKDQSGPLLQFSADAWGDFLDSVKNGDLGI
ncbi:DUF397 domain-containing protein [Streptacidiphilus sp. P02-A3a]|uniref:DUF397 domain-containing protein n=1 Tax=Streptacidiphilus sp. P02-A3a TaxID=2704468 RepID=UPI0015F7DA6F|nr:DUF397 domain-containing protein [Streptacidiphilus sp. P02-A3a]QMU70097.1 DUF397 domain-containing protein [Streptacidiphilus sp. P02-A3a]QMU70450.1 DUF397 domain-containing protein [Streptacidiphilus sp. P02-A3a]